MSGKEVAFMNVIFPIARNGSTAGGSQIGSGMRIILERSYSGSAFFGRGASDAFVGGGVASGCRTGNGDGAGEGAGVGCLVGGADFGLSLMCRETSIMALAREPPLEGGAPVPPDTAGVPEGAGVCEGDRETGVRKTAVVLDLSEDSGDPLRSASIASDERDQFGSFGSDSPLEAGSPRDEDSPSEREASGGTGEYSSGCRSSIRYSVAVVFAETAADGTAGLS